LGKLEVSFKDFSDLIGSGRVFTVPNFQREYAWKVTKNVSALWSDVVRLYRARVEQEETPSHFIGSVVLGSPQAKGATKATTICPVIDGQQRLITVSLLLAALRDVLVLDEDDRHEITSDYLAFYKKAEFHGLRVVPREPDQAVFETIVRNQPIVGVARKSRVALAYEFFAAQLSKGVPVDDIGPDDELAPDAGANEPEIDELDPSGSAEEADDPLEGSTETEEDVKADAWDWEALLEVVGTQLELVEIADVPPNDAYQIFATLNSTGSPLAQVDLVRNAIFMLLPANGAKAFRDHWQPLESALGKDLLERYLHTWVIRRGFNVPAKEVYESAVKVLSRTGSSEEQVLVEVKALRDGAWAYMAVARPLTSDYLKFNDQKIPKGILAGLARLRAWGTTPMEPLLVEILERLRTGTLSAAQVDKLLIHLESFVVRRFIAKTPPHDLRSTLARLVQQVIPAKTAVSFEASLLNGLSEPSRRWPSERQLTEGLVTQPLYRDKNRAQAFFILKRIAEFLDGKEAPHIVLGVGSTDYSIEHVLPQTLSSAWRKDLEAWGDPDASDTWESLRHTAGNLTLTAYNSELSNMRFSAPADAIDKYRWYDTRLKLELTKSILKHDRWTRDEIENRSRWLATIAAQIWPR
jgi:hypothetical protein